MGCPASVSWCTLKDLMQLKAAIISIFNQQIRGSGSNIWQVLCVNVYFVAM